MNRTRRSPEPKPARFALLLAVFIPINAWCEGTGLVGLIDSHLKRKHGIAVDIGCGDAALAVDVAARIGLKVQCLEDSEAAVAAARKKVDAAGVYGRVTVMQAALGRLHFPDHCSNLIFCGDGLAKGLRGRSIKEIHRILNPNGIALIGGPKVAEAELTGWLKDAGVTTFEILKSGGIWAKISKKRPATWGDWDHRGHDPAHTHSSPDQITGKNIKLVWYEPPLPGLANAAILTRNGLIVEIGRGYVAKKRLDTTPYIKVSDAFNGIPLWSKMGMKEVGIDRPLVNYSPIRTTSDVVLTDDSLYILGGKKCHRLDVFTGKSLGTWEIPTEAKAGEKDLWLYLAKVGDTFLGSTGASPKHDTRGFGSWGGPHWRGISTAVFALDATGKQRWVLNQQVETASLVAEKDRLFFITTEKSLHAVDIASGKFAWKAATKVPAKGRITHAALYRGKLWVMYHPKGKLTSKPYRDAGWNVAVFSAKDGKLLHEPTFKSPVSAMTFSEGEAFMAPQHSGGQIYRLNTETGKILNTMLKGKGHSKCTPILATPNWVLYRHQAGSGFSRIDRKSGEQVFYAEIRVSCHYPGLPANGMLYVQGPGCNCAHVFRGHVAYATGDRSKAKLADKDRLVKGPAFGKAGDEKDENAWPTWRADTRHSGHTTQTINLPAEKLWARKLKAKTTPLAAAQGLVFCGTDNGKMVALDAKTGEVKWQRFADARVEIVPHWWNGKLYFGDDAGWAWCLRASDGEVVWKFNATLVDDMIVGDGSFMNASPVGSGVLVHDGTAYFACGFSPDEVGRFYAVDATTGALKWTRAGKKRLKIGSPRGAMVVSDSVLYVPTVGGPPRGVMLKKKDNPIYDPRTYWGGAGSARGRWLMTVGDDLIAGSPTLEYTHHVASYYDHKRLLPVVTNEAIFMRDGRKLTADKRAAYAVHKKIGAFTYAKSKNKGKLQKSPKAADLLWEVTGHPAITAVILAGDTLFAGSKDKVTGYDAKTGKETWSGAVEGTVRDLAVEGGRLLVTTGNDVTCYGVKK